MEITEKNPKEKIEDIEDEFKSFRRPVKNEDSRRYKKKKEERRKTYSLLINMKKKIAKFEGNSKYLDEVYENGI